MSARYRIVSSTKSRGLSTVGWVLMIPVVIIVLLILAVGFYEGRKMYWDSKVRDMCEENGGAIVSERVELSEDEYKNLGGKGGVIPIPDESSPNKASPYFAKSSTIEISSGNPRVTKRETIILHRANERVLGKLILYSRVGGDFPLSFGHPTYFTCSDVLGTRLNLEKQVFIVKEVSK